MFSGKPPKERTSRQRAVDERLERVKEARELYAIGKISKSKMASILLEIQLERIQSLRSRGIIGEDGTTNSLIDTLVSTEPLTPEFIAFFLNTVPANVQEALETGLARGPHMEAEWDEFPVLRFGATEEGLKEARLLVRRNIEFLRRHFGLDP